MKIRILSDLHLEFGEWPSDLAFEPVDLVILAGDIHIGDAGVHWAKHQFPNQPVVYVMGNHEHYKGDLDRTLAAARAAAADSNIHVLERDKLELPNCTILGATLWTDFKLLGPENEYECRATALSCLNDYRLIRYKGTRLRPMDTQWISTFSYNWLDHELKAASKPIIVVTHHCPSRLMHHPGFPMDEVTANFLSDYDALLRPPVKLWVTGHTHHNHDLVHEGVRLISHQRGYPRVVVEGFSWDRVFAIDI